MAPEVTNRGPKRIVVKACEEVRDRQVIDVEVSQRELVLFADDPTLGVCRYASPFSRKRGQYGVFSLVSGKGMGSRKKSSSAPVSPPTTKVAPPAPPGAKPSPPPKANEGSRVPKKPESKGDGDRSEGTEQWLYRGGLLAAVALLAYAAKKLWDRRKANAKLPDPKKNSEVSKTDATGRPTMIPPESVPAPKPADAVVDPEAAPEGSDKYATLEDGRAKIYVRSAEIFAQLKMYTKDDPRRMIDARIIAERIVSNGRAVSSTFITDISGRKVSVSVSRLDGASIAKFQALYEKVYERMSRIEKFKSNTPEGLQGKVVEACIKWEAADINERAANQDVTTADATGEMILVPKEEWILDRVRSGVTIADPNPLDSDSAKTRVDSKPPEVKSEPPKPKSQPPKAASEPPKPYTPVPPPPRRVGNGPKTTFGQRVGSGELPPIVPPPAPKDDSERPTVAIDDAERPTRVYDPDKTRVMETVDPEEAIRTRVMPTVEDGERETRVYDGPKTRLAPTLKPPVLPTQNDVPTVRVAPTLIDSPKPGLFSRALGAMKSVVTFIPRKIASWWRSGARKLTEPQREAVHKDEYHYQDMPDPRASAVEHEPVYPLEGVATEFGKLGIGKEEARYVLENERLFLKECHQLWRGMGSSAPEYYPRGFAEYFARQYANRVGKLKVGSQPFAEVDRRREREAETRREGTGRKGPPRMPTPPGRHK